VPARKPASAAIAAAAVSGRRGGPVGRMQAAVATAVAEDKDWQEFKGAVGRPGFPRAACGWRLSRSHTSVSSRPRSRSRGHGVWVPAFARTALREALRTRNFSRGALRPPSFSIC
jgi:hypothetical protein